MSLASVTHPALPRRAHRGPAKPRQQARDKLLSRVLAAPDGRSLLATILASGVSRLTAVDAVTPPGSFLAAVIDQVRSESDMPPEIALGVVMSQLSAAAAQAGSTVSWAGDSRQVELSLWLLVLAPSGAGKTLIRDLVAGALGLDLRELPEPGSARAFLNGLSECGGTALWVRDEYGQLMRQIAEGGPLAQLRDYLLRSYDHARLEVTTMSAGKTAVERPVISLFGSSVDSTWASCIDAAMLADGLLARHLFIVAQRRPLAVPKYPMQAMAQAISQAAQGLKERLAERVRYVITPEAEAVYESLWKRTAGQVGANLDPAYFRRVTWSAGRYAVLYHLLLRQPGHEIGAEAMQWGWRMVMLHLEYARQVLSLSDAGFAAKVEKIFDWTQNLIVSQPNLTDSQLVRALIQHFRRDLNNAAEARQLIDFARKMAKSS